MMGDAKILYPFNPILSANAGANTVSAGKSAAAPAVNFQDVLQKELRQVKFSRHALQRLAQREIKLDFEQMERLRMAVDKAAGKGARESLILMDNQMAFVVSVSNRTVITALDGASAKDNVFTNIDSAIVI
ncbi:MAG: flagellar protein [Acidaminococcales bacterium]|nr:flagellar protein [Acidaminococcales bacterium]